MSEFAKYADMKSKGATPRDVYLAAKADAVDAIKMIRLLRQVFELSLAEAKQVTSAAETWSAKQDVAPGLTVYWEGWSTIDGFYLMQARVKEVLDGVALLEDHRKFKIANDGLVEIAIEGAGVASLRVSHLEQPLSARVEKLLRFVDDLSHLNSSVESERKAI